MKRQQVILVTNARERYLRKKKSFLSLSIQDAAEVRDVGDQRKIFSEALFV